MPHELVQDRGRGPEVVGTRVTVYNLLPEFFDPLMTESRIAQLYSLTPEQVAAARAYVFEHADTVFPQHLQIEQKLEEGNPPDVVERAKQSHAAFQSFKVWMSKKRNDAATPARTSPLTPPLSFREWLVEQESKASQG